MRKRRSQRRKLESEGFLIRLPEDARRPDIKIFMRDISAGGIYLWSDIALRVNEEVKLQLRLPSSEKSKTESPMVAFGTVVRTENLPDGKFGLGIRLHAR